MFFEQLESLVLYIVVSRYSSFPCSQEEQPVKVILRVCGHFLTTGSFLYFNFLRFSSSYS
jgi:hypothetical protein